MRLVDFLTRTRRRERETEPAGGRAGSAFADLALFTEASLAMLNRSLLEQATARTGLHLYLIGAAQALAQHHGLGERGFRALANKALVAAGERFPLDCFDAALRTGDQAFARRTLVEGEETMRAWLGGDQNAPLRLGQLAVEWRDLPPPTQ